MQFLFFDVLGPVPNNSLNTYINVVVSIMLLWQLFGSKLDRLAKGKIISDYWQNRIRLTVEAQCRRRVQRKLNFLVDFLHRKWRHRQRILGKGLLSASSPHPRDLRTGQGLQEKRCIILPFINKISTFWTDMTSTYLVNTKFKKLHIFCCARVYISLIILGKLSAYFKFVDESQIRMLFRLIWEVGRTMATASVKWSGEFIEHKLYKVYASTRYVSSLL